jgi:hypothetical protein
MWIFTKHGFISAVRKNAHPDVLTIRARDKQSLEELIAFTGVELAKSPDGDYPYRVFVKPELFAQWVSSQALAVDYNNFKSEVAKQRGHEFAGPLHNVWSAMLEVEDEDARDGEATYVDPNA